MSITTRRTIPLAITFLMGFIFFSEFFIEIPTLTNATKSLLSWAVIIGTFTTVLGTIMLSRFHIKKVVQKGSDWGFSAILLIFLIIFIIIGLIEGPTGKNYYFWYSLLRVPITTTGYGLIYLFSISAAYRTFKVRNLETLLLMLGTVFGFLYYMTLGPVIWQGFVPLGQWIFDVPTKAAARAGTISAGIGSIILGLRVILGQETRLQLGEAEAE